MSELTTIGVALIAGGFALSGGLLTARHQRRSTEQQRRDAAATFRRESYHGFLDVVREFTTMLTSGRDFSTDDFHDWLNRFNHSYNGLRLSGGGSTIAAARQLVTVLGAVIDAPDEGVAGTPISERLRDAYGPQQDTLDEAEAALLTAMLTDLEQPAGET